MFHILLFRLLLIIAVAIIVFSITKYILDPRRKLEAAKNRGEFYLLDDTENIRKNITFTYKTALFEGEKFLDPDQPGPDVTNIMVWSEDIDEIHRMSLRDFQFMERELKLRYPHALVEWRTPVNDWIKRLKKSQDS